ncbi:MAG TPA: hypothetical protein VGW33_11820 [Terriglobia bacterium]|nr:hypothetical protein [Terriglobia bacterium]
MELKPLAFVCPQCGSPDVIYSCKPDCCFNHVCGKCYTTFEPVTTRVGELAADPGPLPADPDPSGPTAACARCGESTLFVIASGSEAGRIFCVACKALLTLELSEIVAG